MATKLYRCEFIGGPRDGEVVEIDLATVRMSEETTGPSGQRHLWLLDESEWGYAWTYQGAMSACAGR